MGQQISLGILLLALATGAHAQTSKTSDSQFSYDFVSVGYDTGSIGILGGDKRTSKSTGVQVSKSITDTFFLNGNFQSTETNSTNTAYNIGGGARVPLSNSTDLSGSVFYSSYDIAGTSPTGYGMGASLRHALTPQLEIGGTYTFTSLESGDLKISTVGAEVRYRITNELSIGLGYKSYQSDASGYEAGLNARLEF